VLAESSWLSIAARREGVDLVHHAGGVVPVAARRPVTLTIHDLQPLDLPANFSRTKRAYLRAMSGRSARRAELVAVPSTFTSDRVQDLLGVAADRLVVVPWSAPSPPAEEAAVDLPTPVATLDEGAPLFLYPAITYPHKNHEVLVRAMAELRRTAPEAHLVCCGRPGPGDDEIRRAAATADLADRVHLLGRVEGPTLDALYRRATATVYPSRYEGFGLPVLEAMARECPVVAADVPALAEVTGDGALLVGPDDVDGWARAMLDVIANPAARAELVAAGRARAATFHPDRTAAGLLGVWARALARS
jgi:glycosyltransferase involved in cell wall biosynthesis